MKDYWRQRRMGTRIKQCRREGCGHAPVVHKVQDIEEEWVPSSSEIVTYTALGKCEVVGCNCQGFVGE